ncbi:MAG: TonB family protein [Candidatus Aminicenantes bacterium]|nr:TonB family protein [Candidatus Aminicenantes bacterium]
MRKAVSFFISLVLHAGMMFFVLNLKITYHVFPLKQRLETFEVMPVEKIYYPSSVPIREEPASEALFEAPVSKSNIIPSTTEDHTKERSYIPPMLDLGPAAGSPGHKETKLPPDIPVYLGLNLSPEKETLPDSFEGTGKRNTEKTGVQDLRRYLYPRNTAPYSFTGESGSGKPKKEQTSVPSDMSQTIPDLTSWAENVVNKVQMVWNVPRMPEGGIPLKARILVTVTREGDLISVRMEKSSGDENWNNAVLKALEDSAPLPSLPPEFLQDRLIVFLVFESDG